jgi:hypothetical protein
VRGGGGERGRGWCGSVVFFVVAFLAVLVEVVFLSHVLPHDEQNGRTYQTGPCQREDIVIF